MNLTDQETLELGGLCDALVDGVITETQKRQLTDWLAHSVAARRFYIRCMAQSASLHAYASEMLSNSDDKIVVPLEPRKSAWRWVAPLAVAASVMFAILLTHPRTAVPIATPNTEEFVARLTASKDCVWTGETESMRPGDFLVRGQTCELAGGLAEITFDSGACVILEGPSVIQLNSAWEATLRRGVLKASVPPQAIGFKISNPSVEVVDLGTEFTMIAEGGGATEVLVLKGAVEADPTKGGDQDLLVLHENESLRFTREGVSQISDSESKFARFNQPLSLDKFAPAPNYVHWSFDELEGGRFESLALGMPRSQYPADMHQVTAGDLVQVHARGRKDGGLRFDGQHYATAPFPSLSANGPRTVAFWIKVPSDTQLSEAYAMAAWLPSSLKLQFHPIHIGWNRNPSEGAVGVLRADYARGFALGTTPLRTGRWHHVAVVFVPGAEADTPLQVKLYLDGRFEGEGRPSPPGRREDSTKSPEDYTKETQDILWLGCRLGSDGPRSNRFRGVMDELFIADRELEPSEIVELMKENTLSPQPILLGSISSGQRTLLKAP